MPAPADRLLDAVIAVLLEEGFEGVSVRRVATRAGVSIGAVQHHFPTKDAMLTGAMDRVSSEFQQQLTAGLPRDPSAEQALRAMVAGLLGSDAGSYPGTIIWTQRIARAMVDPAMRRRHAVEWQEVEGTLSGLVQAVRTDRDATWASDQAALLMAVLDGLSMAQVAEPERMPAARAEQIVGDLLDQLLAGTPSSRAVGQRANRDDAG